MVKNYIIVHRTHYRPNEAPPFVLAFAQADVYASREVHEHHLRKLRQDINELLDEDSVRMTYGDLGLTDPDDIAF